MLAALARFLQGPPLAVIAGLTLLQLLAMHVPLLLFGMLFAGIAAAFLVLARPLREAVGILIAAGALCALISYLLTGDLSAFLAPLVFLGVPALLAAVLRLSGSLALAVLGGFLGGWLGAKLLGWTPLDLDQAWTAVLSARQETLEAEQFGAFLELLSVIGTEMVMASLVLLSSLLLLLARSWQSALAEAPFFAAEFRAMRYGRIADIAFLAFLAATVAVAFWWEQNPFLLGLALTLVVAFLFPGLATVHRLSDRVRYPLAILLPLYVLLLIREETILVVATLGAAEDLLGWSRQATGRGGAA